MTILLKCTPEKWNTDISAVDYALASIYSTPVPNFPYKRSDGSIQIDNVKFNNIDCFKFYVKGNDPLRYSGHRAEFTSGQGVVNKAAWDNVTLSPSGTVTRWYSFAFRCESPWNKFEDSTQTCVLFQLHQNGDTLAAGNPSPYNGDDVVGPVLLGLFCHGKKWQIRSSYSSVAITGNYNETVIYDRDIVTDEWQYVTVKIKFGWNNDGETVIYWNHREVFKQTNINNAHNNYTGPFMKFGVYLKNHNLDTEPYPADRVIFHRGVIVGDGNSTFNEVQFDNYTELPRSTGKAIFKMR